MGSIILIHFDSHCRVHAKYMKVVSMVIKQIAHTTPPPLAHSPALPLRPDPQLHSTLLLLPASGFRPQSQAQPSIHAASLQSHPNHKSYHTPTHPRLHPYSCDSTRFPANLLSRRLLLAHIHRASPQLAAVQHADRVGRLLGRLEADYPKPA